MSAVDVAFPREGKSMVKTDQVSVVLAPVLRLDGSRGSAKTELRTTCWRCQCGWKVAFENERMGRVGHTTYERCSACGVRYEILSGMVLVPYVIKELPSAA